MNQFGLPSAETLRSYRIWDSYFTPAHSHPGADGISHLLADINRSKFAIELGKIERSCYFPHVGVGTTSDRELESLLRTKPEVVLQPFNLHSDRLIGMIQLNGHDVSASIDAINRWLRDGPMLGVYFPGGGPAAMACNQPNVRKLVAHVVDLGGLIMQHTWLKSGGKQNPGESTPAELVELASQFPEQKFVCAHAGGNWEPSIRAVREYPNIFVETSGFDATAGFIEMAVRELTSRRIVFGSHLPSRSLGTELSKVIAAEINETDKRRILGENFRQLLANQVGLGSSPQKNRQADYTER